MAGLRHRFPQDPPVVLRRRLADLWLGPELSAVAYGPPPELAPHFRYDPLCFLRRYGSGASFAKSAEPAVAGIRDAVECVLAILGERALRIPTAAAIYMLIG